MPHRDIRAAEEADTPAVTALLHELGYPSNTDEDVAGRLADWSGRDDLLVLVAVEGTRVVGVAALAVVPYFERPGRWGRLVALVVDAHVREKGVGRQLLAAAEREALARGCVCMEISSARHRADAHAFYAALGYADRCGVSARFHKNLRKDFRNNLHQDPGAEGVTHPEQSRLRGTRPGAPERGITPHPYLEPW